VNSVVSRPLILTVYITGPSQECLETMAQTLLAEKRIACANLMAPHQSYYSWQGEMKNELEWAMLLKSQIPLQDSLEKRISELHPFETPCILFHKLECEPQFHNWVVEQTSGI